MTIALSQFDEVRLDRVSRDFGALNALRDISLTIRRREFIALLGPSGCGKSTTLNCIAGLLPVTGGAIWLDKSRVDTLRPEERGFGMVFQNYALFPHLNVRQNIGFGLKMRGTPKAEMDRKVNEALALVRLQGQENKLPGQLSGGQQQRVAIARAIVIEPPLVLMDEPLSNLDAKLRLEMRAEIRRIHNELGATTIYVTHDQDEALSLADRIVVLRDGVVRQVGTPKELYEAPAHLDVADFMGFRNKLKGKVVAVENGRAVLDVEGARISGVARERLSPGSSAYAAIRPDDLEVGEAGPNAIAVTVDTIEYRGREFVGTAHSAGGFDFVFRSHQAVEPGSTVYLRADDGRVLVFAEPTQGRN
ncbi:ABC transporter ATP-binding protein [Microvirga aerilata]|uniref:ABC transporter ATP-binding protein n=1 Tax=Microvirga aerilata TaxID=670292 RepID=A0A937D024_9HYPH|nr:ABC transporter ATP-binding protein [Microvirga aerilata]MBL0402555.1 ABC transporter ATP-binding protein [Microvirga aerilata]